MIIADTHIIIWDALRPWLLSTNARKAIDKANSTDGIIFCTISLWEMAMLIRKNRLEIPIPYLEFIGLVRSYNKYTFMGISPEIAELSANLSPEINLDPADRIIGATSVITNTPLVTADKNLLNAKNIKTIW